MTINIPKIINIKNAIFKLLALIMLSVATYFFSKSTWVGVLVFVVTFLLFPIVSRASLNYRYKQYLESVGQKYKGVVTDEIYEKSVMGFVPFMGKVVSCFVYADSNGVLIRKSRVSRFISWDSIVSYEKLESLGRPVLRLALKLETSSSILIPWKPEFNEYLAV